MSKANVDEISDRQARNQTGLNKKQQGDQYIKNIFYIFYFFFCCL